MKNGEIAEQGSHEDLIKKKVCSCKCFKGILLFSNYRTVIMRAWLRLMSQEPLTKETERKAKLVRNVQSSASSSLQTETSSMSPNEEEAALQKDLEEESSGNGEVLNPTKHSH